MDGYLWNLAQILAVCVGIAEKVFIVSGQRSRFQRDWMHFCGGYDGMYVTTDNGVVLRLTC